MRRKFGLAGVVLTAGLGLALAACGGDTGPMGPEGPQGPQGPQGEPGTPGQDGRDGVSTGGLMGTVTNALTGAPLDGADVTVTLSPDVASITVDANGAYEATLPVGFYSLVFSADGYEDAELTVSVVADATPTYDVALTPSEPASVDAGADQTVAPGASASVTASYSAMDGSTAASWQWTVVSGLGTINGAADGPTVTVDVPDIDTLKAELVSRLQTPDRARVLGINPFAIEETVVTVLQVTVTSSSGDSYTDTVEVHADADFAVSTGIQNVPIGVPVMVQAPSSASYSWTLTAPAGSSAALDDPSSQWPIFTPDVSGTYTLAEATSGTSLTLTAGQWQGAITGLSASDGLPEAANCTACHDGGSTGAGAIGAKFDAWRQSGHAHIFTQNIDNPDGHWGTYCASCHGVGYNPDADNGGWDEAMTQDGWTVPHGAVGNYQAMFASAPNTARMANIQCENCHGPNQSDAHMAGIAGRVDYASDLCASCHGEPKRHARFQQWQESGHSSMELATRARGCGAKCHTAQGFIEWAENGFTGSVTPPAAGTEQPQTCVACHDPHNPGTSSGDPNEATVRQMDNTGMLDAGFIAFGVGNGALCMQCHNSRRGLRNDYNLPGDWTRAPHGPSQADILMGQNVYFVEPGERGPHSYIDNTCSGCHMSETPPPEELSYNLSGTNHTFEASLDVCGNCHEGLDGANVQAATAAGMTALHDAIAAQVVADLNALGMIYASAINTTTEASSTALVAVDTSANPVTDVHVTSGHGRLEFELTFTNGISITWDDSTTSTVTSFAVRFDQLYSDAGTTTVYGPSGTLFRAAWNYMMLVNDKSLGVHNPGLYSRVISATLNQQPYN